MHIIYDHMGNPWVGGGGAVRAYEVNRRLAGNGYGITTLSGNYKGARDYSQDGIDFKFVGNPGNYLASTFSFPLKAAGFLKRHSNEYDLVVEDFAPWNPVFSFLLTKRPIVLHVNHKEGIGILRRWSLPGIPFYLIEKFYPRLFRNITALSEGTKDKMGSPRAFVLPAGIAQEIILSEPVPEEKRGDYILYVGRLHIKNKGLDTLLKAMDDVPKKLILLGRGPDENKLREMARGRNIEFAGFAEEPQKLKMLERAKILILPSRFEGFGIVLLEAAARGTPVVVSDIPELSFAVKNGFGISFKTGNHRDLAGKINLLAENSHMRKGMGLKGLSFARENTWDKVALSYKEYLERIAHE